MLEALLAALAMLINDCLDVLMVDSEARNHPLLPGFIDTFKYYPFIAYTTISVSVLTAHNTREKVFVLVAVGLGSFIGRFIGVKLGKKFIKEEG